MQTARLLQNVFGLLFSENPTNVATVNADKLNPANTFTKIIILVTSIYSILSYIVGHKGENLRIIILKRLDNYC